MTRTLGRMLLVSAVAAVMLHGKAVAQEETSLGRILEYQKKLNDEAIDYENPDSTTLHDALNDLLTRQGIPWTVNETALVASQQDKDVIQKTEIGKIDRRSRVTRATILKYLLERMPNDGGPGRPTYVLRRSGVEITTVGAKIAEARGLRVPGDDPLSVGLAPFPPLAYAAFNGTPLEDALKELARSTESTIMLDGRVSTEAKGKVTVDLNGVPLDAAVELLADTANLKLVRVANIYYVTSPQNADRLQKEEDRRRRELAGEDPPAAAPAPGPTASGPAPQPTESVVKPNPNK